MGVGVGVGVRIGLYASPDDVPVYRPFLPVRISVFKNEGGGFISLSCCRWASS